eukprot:TRINITY_DN2026_c0_g1_i1.p1 TRINITY_DN2026_c0_g1~~TRINITY_DN2026_c0_g1_i1.p1  ORF type:complete len:78 (-),score=10.39 TRINITY_DN2026_c0_g1_i1:115-348(-)
MPAQFYDEVVGRKVPPWKTITKRAWVSLAIGVIAQLIAGSNYAFFGLVRHDEDRQGGIHRVRLTWLDLWGILGNILV